MREKIDLKFKFILIGIISLVINLSLITAATITDDLHLNIQTTNSSGSVVTGTFKFEFNISTSSDCTNIIYTNLTSLTTDSRGIISYYLPNVTLNFSEQYWLCYYRDGTLINASKIARVPYTFTAKNISAEGIKNDSNLNLAGFNITGSSGLFSWLGSLASRITKLFVQDIDFIGNINGSGNITTTGYIGIGTESPIQNLHVIGDANITGTLYADIIAGESLLNVNNSDYLDSYDSSFFMPLNTSVSGNFDFNAGTLYIDSATNRIGIGTITPSNILDVRGTGNFSGTIYINNATDVSTLGGGGIPIVLNNSYEVYFNQSYPTFINISNLLFVNKTSGFVGINTTSPTTALHVAGTLNVTNIVLESNCAEGQVLKWSAQGIGTCGNDAIAGYWNLTGNNLFPASMDYNVGIGTTTPGTKLGILANALIVAYTGTNLSNVGIELDSGKTDGAYTTHGINFKSNLNNSFIYSYSTAQHNNNLIFGTTNRERMRIDSSGNVGIGTTTPGSNLAGTTWDVTGKALDVYEGTNSAHLIAQGTAGGAVLDLIDLGGAGNDKWLQLTVDSGIAQFRTITDAAGIKADNILVMDIETGNVGIGTASPAGKLHTLNTAADQHNYLVIENSLAAYQAALQLKTGTANADWIMYVPGSSTDLRLYRGGDKVTFQAGGNVGIGTTSPGAKLEVNGVVKASLFNGSTYHPIGPRDQTPVLNNPSSPGGGVWSSAVTLPNMPPGAKAGYSPLFIGTTGETIAFEAATGVTLVNGEYYYHPVVSSGSAVYRTMIWVPVDENGQFKWMSNVAPPTVTLYKPVAWM